MYSCSGVASQAFDHGHFRRGRGRAVRAGGARASRRGGGARGPVCSLSPSPANPVPQRTKSIRALSARRSSTWFIHPVRPVSVRRRAHGQQRRAHHRVDASTPTPPPPTPPRPHHLQKIAPRPRVCTVQKNVSTSPWWRGLCPSSVHLCVQPHRCDCSSRLAFAGLRLLCASAVQRDVDALAVGDGSATTAPPSPPQPLLSSLLGAPRIQPLCGRGLSRVCLGRAADGRFPGGSSRTVE